MDAQKVWKAWQSEPAHELVAQLAARPGQGVWLVGGAVRDALLGRPVADWDLAVVRSADFVAALARKLHARPVVLHEDTDTYRLVLKSEGAPPRQLDVSQLRAPTIESDLLARDLTINSLGVDAVSGALLDPCQGLSDLRHHRVRALSLANLQADPLRCLRVYRFASQLAFTIDSHTRQWVRATAAEIRRVPGERVRDELLKTLNPPRAAQALGMMDEDTLLGQLIPEIEPSRGVEQGRYHHLDVWGHTLDVVARLEEILEHPAHFLPHNEDAILHYLERRRLRPVLLLTALLHDLAKPACRTQEEHGWWRFFEHDVEGARLAGHIMGRMAMRRDDARTVRHLIRGHLRPLQLANLQLPRDGREPQEITMSALRRLFRDAHPDGIGLLLLGLADARGCRGPATEPGYHERLAPVLDDMLTRFLAYRTERASRPLINGDDLVAAGYQPGRRFGEVLAAVEDAYADGVVQSKREAMELVASMLGRGREGHRPPRGEQSPTA